MPHWTTAELDELKSVFADNGAKACLRSTERHSIQSIRVMAQKLGIKRTRVWTREEIMDVIYNYPTKGTVGCELAKATHSPASIMKKARDYGLCYYQT